jgi:hypothetical protein
MSNEKYWKKYVEKDNVTADDTLLKQFIELGVKGVCNALKNRLETNIPAWTKVNKYTPMMQHYDQEKITAPVNMGNRHTLK